jgi:hypothetical protein
MTYALVNRSRAAGAMTKNSTQDARDYSVLNNAGQDNDLDASVTTGEWSVAGTFLPRIYTALPNAGKTAGVISSLHGMTD